MRVCELVGLGAREEGSALDTVDRAAVENAQAAAVGVEGDRGGELALGGHGVAERGDVRRLAGVDLEERNGVRAGLGGVLEGIA